MPGRPRGPRSACPSWPTSARRDLALGGQAAPLAPYLDGALFAHPTETRVLLNLGGIANLTVLAAGRDPVAFDTGPANMVIDALALRLTGRATTSTALLAAAGTPDDALLDELLADPYFALPPPKSTGREDFGADFVRAPAGGRPRYRERRRDRDGADRRDRRRRRPPVRRRRRRV